MDILDTMVASDVETSVAANGVRENVLACTGGGTDINFVIIIILNHPHPHPYILIIPNMIIRRKEEEKKTG